MESAPTVMLHQVMISFKSSVHAVTSTLETKLGDGAEIRGFGTRGSRHVKDHSEFLI